MPERQFQRILAFVYNNKYQYQIRLDEMQCVGTALAGKGEVITTPSGHVKKVRVNPEVTDMHPADRNRVILSAYSSAKAQGFKVQQEAEDRIYRQFLRDIKPIVLGIRDNPEFYTVDENAVELPGGVVIHPTTVGTAPVYRTIPYFKATSPRQEIARRTAAEQAFFATKSGKQYLLTLRGKTFQRYCMPEKLRPRGAPGRKQAVTPLEIMVPYTAMDEKRLQQKNWQAYLDNKHVAETTWTKIRLGDRYKLENALRRTGAAWHAPINPEAEDRW